MVAKEKSATSDSGINDTTNSVTKTIAKNIKTAFFEKENKIVLTIYIKSLSNDQIEFSEDQIKLRFKTKDANFLKQHNTDDSNMLFEWNIELTNRINPAESAHKITKCMLEIEVTKHESASGKWTEVIKIKDDHLTLKKVIHEVNGLKIKTRSPSPPLRAVLDQKMTTSKPPDYIPSAFYGRIGLQNLGNTCYMNAAIQSLINLTDLRDYFIETSSIFQKDINTSNALGLNGKMAVSVALLIRQLWKGNKSFISPQNLRDLICTKYAHFRGYEQQDTQEFMCSLLSIMHEDLNRVLKKPFYENNLECSSDSFEHTAKVACDAWQRFLTRENSFVTDNFYGQFKSKLTCPSCDKVSITFEPFSNLLVPLPSAKQPCMCIVIVKDELPLKLKLYISEDEGVGEVLGRLKERYEHFKNKSLSMFVLNQKEDENEVLGFEFNQDWENLPNTSKIPKLKSNQIFIIYEFDDSTSVNEPVLEIRVQQVCKQPTLSNKCLNNCAFCKTKSSDEPSVEKKALQRCTKCYRSAYCGADCQKSDWQRHSHNTCNKPLDVVGLPFVLTFRQSELTDELDFTRILNLKLLEHSSSSTDVQTEKSDTKFEINLITDPANQKNPPKINASELLNDFKNSKLHQHVVKVQLKWNNDNSASKNALLQIVTNLERLKDLTRDGLREPKTNLHDCMKLFTEPETLTNENPWYCSNCKEHQKARKQMSLWKLPKYLIITLKRFHAHKASDAPQSSNNYLNYLIQNRLAYNKLNTFIEYPLKKLNMNQYISDQTNKTNYCYDLCSVINHIGQSLYLGHYTAFARTHDRVDSSKDELGWRLFDDAHVQTVNNLDHLITQDAYVLVYRLRTHENSLVDNDLENNDLEQAGGEGDLDVSSSEDEYFNSNSDESEELNSHCSSGSLDAHVDGDGSRGNFTNLNDID